MRKKYLYDTIFIFVSINFIRNSFFRHNINLTFERFIEIIRIIIWPAIVLLALLFFKKVFTYLFFSMEEFNFFGAKGRLKDISEVIEGRVKMRLDEDKNEKSRAEETKKLNEEFEKIKLSKDSIEKQNVEWAELANKIFKKYRKFSNKNSELKKELDSLRKEKLDRENILINLRERNERFHKKDFDINNNFSKDTDVPKADKMSEIKKTR